MSLTARATMVVSLAGGLASFAFADSFTIETLNYPNAAQTAAIGINDSGQIVGYYTDTPGSNGLNTGPDYAFLYSANSFQQIIVPGANGLTQALDINNSGQITGGFASAAGYQGFVDTNGTFQTIEGPAGTNGEVAVWGINNSGQISGVYADAAGFHGFEANSDGSNFTIINGPNGTGAVVTQINDQGQIVGYGGGCSGFIYSNGAYTAVTDPNGCVTNLLGINDAGVVTGITSSGTTFAYNSVTGTFTTLPAGFSAQGINDSDQIAGFFASPEPSTFAMSFAALFAVAVYRVRRRKKAGQTGLAPFSQE